MTTEKQDTLRKRAETKLKFENIDVSGMSEADVRKALYELHTHQIELEIQNEELRLAQVDLEESRSTFSDLYDFAPVGYITISDKGLIIKPNLTASKMLGMERSKLLKQPITTFFSAEDQDDHYSCRKKILETKEDQTCEKHIRARDGREFYVHCRCTIDPLIDGNSGQFRMVLSDISGKKQLKKELQTAHKELKHSYEQLQATEKILRIKNRLAYIFLNIEDDEMFHEVLEIILEVMKSKFGVFGYIDENEDLVVPSMTRHIWDECNVADKKIVFPRESWGCSSWPRAIREKKSNFSNEPSQIVPKGHVPILRHLTVPILHREKVVGLFQIANKRTDYCHKNVQFLEEIASTVAPVLDARLKRDRFKNQHQQAINSLSNSKERITLLLNSTAEGIFGLDLDGMCTFQNASCLNLLGYDKDESLVGQKMHALTHHTRMDGSQYPENECLIYHASQNKEGVHADHEVFWRRDGRSFPVEYWSFPIWENRECKGSVVTFIDISERKQAEKQQDKLQAQFNQAQKMESVGRLAGGVAHDFNNMLSVILGYTDMALEKIEPSDLFFKELTIIRSAAQRSASLTRQLLAFARKQTIEPRILALNDVVADLLKLLRRLIGEDITLLWKPGANLGLVKLDPAQVDQILANLCVNARDAITSVGTITIETSNTTFDEDYCAGHPGFIPGSFVLLAVSDNGCGMDKEIVGNIFEPFFSTKELGQGTGLGLSTVYGIAKQNNGFLNVYSEPGLGTTFKVYIPRHEDTGETCLDEEESTTVTGGHETILLVEDEEMILKLGTKMLKSLGYLVLDAQTPSKALELVQEHGENIDLLITDIVMPEMNGKDLAGHVRNIHKTKVLYMSGYTADVIARHGILDEGFNFIQKPFSKKELAAKVREVLNGTEKE